MRTSLVVLLASVSIAECNRAPAEDFSPPPATTSRAVTSGTPIASAAGSASASAARSSSFAASSARPSPGRCVAWTPSAAPAPVAPGPAPGCPPDPEGPLAPAAMVRVEFPDVGGVSVDAEFVRSEHDTTRGLMYRRSMAPDHGMLFDLREREEHRFWMHNTCIPLDMLFVDEDGFIVGIVENAPTLNDDARSVGCPSRWVLEVNAGWARRHGVKAGGHMTLPQR